MVHKVHIKLLLLTAHIYVRSFAGLPGNEFKKSKPIHSKGKKTETNRSTKIRQDHFAEKQLIGDPWTLPLFPEMPRRPACLP
jgi:hypothetical protein